MSSISAQKMRLPEGTRPLAKQRSRPATLFTPAAIGWIAFLCTLPAGFILAALNYSQAGQGRQGLARLSCAFVTLGLFWGVIGNAGALSGVLGFGLEIAGIVYLVRDARALHRHCRATVGAYNAPTTNAVIIGVIVLVVTVALMVGYVGRVIG